MERLHFTTEGEPARERHNNVSRKSPPQDVVFFPELREGRRPPTMTRRLCFSLCLLWFALSARAAESVILSEFMAENETGLTR